MNKALKNIFSWRRVAPTILMYGYIKKKFIPSLSIARITLIFFIHSFSCSFFEYEMIHRLCFFFCSWASPFTVELFLENPIHSCRNKDSSREFEHLFYGNSLVGIGIDREYFSEESLCWFWCWDMGVFSWIFYGPIDLDVW